MSAAQSAGQAPQFRAYLGANMLFAMWKFDGELTTHQKVGFYILGMGAYAVSIATRIGGLIKDIILLFFYEPFLVCKRCDITHLWDRVKTIGRDLCEIPIAILGVFCPLAAYKLDDNLFDPFSDCDYLNELIVEMNAGGHWVKQAIRFVGAECQYYDNSSEVGSPAWKKVFAVGERSPLFVG